MKGASRFGEGHEPACHLRLPRVCLHLAHPSMYGTTCPYLPFGCQPSRQCVVSMRRTSRPFLMYTAPPARRGRRIHAARELWQGNRPARTKMPLCWQDVANMRSRALDDGKMLARCVPQRPTVTGLRPNALLAWLAVAIYSRGAFPSALPWQDFTTVRSRALADGKMLAKCVPGRQSVASFALHASRKRPRTGKSPVRGSILPPCIQNELALARYARHASETPRKPPSEDTPREDLARKGRFSLHGPLESCIVRRSCHPPPNSASDRNHGVALMGSGTGRGRLLVGRGDAAKGVRGVVRCLVLAARRRRSSGPAE